MSSIFDFTSEVFPPCPDAQIQAAETRLGFSFPEWYVDFLKEADGAEQKYEYCSVGENFMQFNGYLSLEGSVILWEREKSSDFNIFPFGACDGWSLIGFDMTNFRIFFLWVDTREKFLLASTLEEFLTVIENESFAYHLNVKYNMGEISREEYVRQLATRKP
jgi:hypothetical protein